MKVGQKNLKEHLKSCCVCVHLLNSKALIGAQSCRLYASPSYGLYASSVHILSLWKTRQDQVQAAAVVLRQVHHRDQQKQERRRL